MDTLFSWQVKELQAEYAAVLQKTEKLVEDIRQAQNDRPDYCAVFTSAEAAEKMKQCPTELKSQQESLVKEAADFADGMTYCADFERLSALKTIAEGSTLPLSLLLQRAGAERANALSARLLKDQAGKSAEDILRTYTATQKALREKARDKAAFDKLFAPEKPKQSSAAQPGQSPVNMPQVAASFANIKVGSVIQFGHYPQNADGKDSTPIDWQVLEVKDGMALLITDKAVDCKQYNEAYVDIPWKKCTLRQWLNGDFISKAFTQQEQTRIQTARVTADKNPEYSTNPGKGTNDKVFLLSINEANQFFKTDEDRKCVPTEYAKAQGAWTSDKYTKGGAATCWWWLRSPGSTRRRAAFVDHDGSVSCGGIPVGNGRDCVRPALWINQ